LQSNKTLPKKEISFINVYKAELILLGITLSWGLTFPLIKLSLQFISPVLFIFLRFLITLIVFSFFFRNKIRFTQFKEWKNGIILGGFLFVGFAFQTIGLQFTTASKSAFITGTAVVIIPFAQYFILRSIPKPENIFGAVIVMIGLYVLSEAYISQPNIGDILTLLSAVAFAFHIVFLDKYSRVSGFYDLAFGQFASMTLVSFIFMLFMEVIFSDRIFIELTPSLIITILYGSIIATMLTIVLMTKYQRETTPLRAGIIYSMESVSAVFFAFIITSELLNLNQITGALIMITGLMISELYGYIKLKFSDGSKS